jgi:hypothetical protein
LWNGTFLVGAAESLPVGVDFLIGNDIAAAAQSVDTLVVTRSQAAKQRSAETSEKSISNTEEISLATELSKNAECIDLPPNANETDVDYGLTSLFTESVDLTSVSGKDDLIKLQHSSIL